MRFVHWAKLSCDLIVKILRHVGAIEGIEGRLIDKRISSISAINLKIFVALEDEEVRLMTALRKTVRVRTCARILQGPISFSISVTMFRGSCHKGSGLKYYEQIH